MKIEKLFYILSLVIAGALLIYISYSAVERIAPGNGTSQVIRRHSLIETQNYTLIKFVIYNADTRALNYTIDIKVDGNSSIVETFTVPGREEFEYAHYFSERGEHELLVLIYKEGMNVDRATYHISR